MNLEGRGYPQLYDMQTDEPENYSVAARYPDVLEDMQRRFRQAEQTFAPFKSKPTQVPLIFPRVQI